MSRTYTPELDPEALSRLDADAARFRDAFAPGRPHVRPGGKLAAKGMPRLRWLRRLGALDQVVEWIKPEGRPE